MFLDALKNRKKSSCLTKKPVNWHFLAIEMSKFALICKCQALWNVELRCYSLYRFGCD